LLCDRCNTLTKNFIVVLVFLVFLELCQVVHKFIDELLIVTGQGLHISMGTHQVPCVLKHQPVKTYRFDIIQLFVFNRISPVQFTLNAFKFTTHRFELCIRQVGQSTQKLSCALYWQLSELLNEMF
jgi:hypothetical protein